jgi:hypothetical protein
MTSPEPEADPERRRVAELMTSMAARDTRAVFALVDELGDRLRSAVRAQLRSYGRADLLRDADELEHPGRCRCPRPTVTRRWSSSTWCSSRSGP